jgi:hypothetical protein
MFIDASTITPDIEGVLKKTFEMLQIQLAMNVSGDSDAACLVVVDDLSTFEWVSTSATEVTRFARAVGALCAKVCARHSGDMGECSRNNSIAHHSFSDTMSPCRMTRTTFFVCFYSWPRTTSRSGH